MDKIDPRLEDVMEAISRKDFPRAIALLAPLEKEGVPDAFTNLAFLYSQGLGVPADGPKAVEIYKKAIALGSGLAAHNLGTLYVTGARGLERDPQLGKSYFRKARSMGCQLADDKFYE